MKPLQIECTSNISSLMFAASVVIIFVVALLGIYYGIFNKYSSIAVHGTTHVGLMALFLFYTQSYDAMQRILYTFNFFLNIKLTWTYVFNKEKYMKYVDR